jgi:hypothetical protein
MRDCRGCGADRGVGRNRLEFGGVLVNSALTFRQGFVCGANVITSVLLFSTSL